MTRSPWLAKVAMGFIASLSALGCAESEPLSLDGRSGPSDAAPASDGATGGAAKASGGSSGHTGAAGREGNSGQGGIGGSFTGSSGSAGHSEAAGTTGRGGGAGTPLGGSNGAHSDGSAAATFTEIYKDILTVYCGGSSCHTPGTQHGVGFSTQSGAYKSLLSVAVIPGNSQGSTLYTNLATGTMPAGEPMLSSALIDEVAAWIDAGALNN